MTLLALRDRDGLRLVDEQTGEISDVRVAYFGWVLLRGRVWTEVDGTMVQLPRVWARVGPAHPDRASAITWARRFRQGYVGRGRTRLLSTGSRERPGCGS